jgi:hypothetical protein
MKHGNTAELSVPPEVGNLGAAEAVRAWVTSERGIYAINPDAFDEPEFWGMLYADLVRHTPQAVAGKHNLDSLKVEAAIVSMLRKELKRPTDTVSGRIERP